MQSCYLRSLHGELFEPCDRGLCAECGGPARLRVTVFRFCRQSHASRLHLRIDLGAASRVIQAQIVLVRRGLLPELAAQIGRRLYAVWRRERALFACVRCARQVTDSAQFVDDLAFCSTRCRELHHTGYYAGGQVYRSTRARGKSTRELSQQYGPIW
jgi:endogenous inhibitor of DNA gyrase (YacG/DUF329 family)